jgi:hypothetical protein
LCLLPSRALTLDGGSNVLEGSPLLLELSFRLLARAPLLVELLVHYSERRGLHLHGNAQLLGLLGLLLRLSLSGLCPLEGGTVLLQLSLRLSQGRLPLR